MNAAIMKIAYLLMCVACIVIGMYWKRLKHKDIMMPLFFTSLAFCWGWWGVSSIFHNAEGYPPQWFFYVASTPVFIITVIMTVKTKK